MQRTEDAMILLPEDGDAAPAPLLPDTPETRSELSDCENPSHLNIRLKVSQWQEKVQLAGRDWSRCVQE